MILKDCIKAYLYTNYMNDDNVRAFFTAFNSVSQEMYDWMLAANLPIFIGSSHSGDELRWLVKGIYGQNFPYLVTRKTTSNGPYNTFVFNSLPYNGRKQTTVTNNIATSDDIFKRILTWNFYKGDGMHFTVTWLKRRVMRFLLGVDGTDVLNDTQAGISVIFDGNGGIIIGINSITQYVTNSALYGTDQYNGEPIGSMDVSATINGDFQYAGVLKAAFENGLLRMPFWSNVSVNITGQ